MMPLVSRVLAGLSSQFDTGTGFGATFSSRGAGTFGSVVRPRASLNWEPKARGWFTCVCEATDIFAAGGPASMGVLNALSHVLDDISVEGAAPDVFSGL